MSEDDQAKLDRVVIITAAAHAELRKDCMSWAVSTAREGEELASIMARAQRYVDFVCLPLRQQVAVAMAESHGQTRH